MDYQIFPPEEIQAEIGLPLSKSISNRVLLINALIGNKGNISHVADCEDTVAMNDALASGSQTINVGAAGTAMRFLTAYFAIQSRRTVTIDGSERMRERPIRALVDALRACGAEIEYLGKDGFPPLKITGKTLKGGDITLDGSISSQYVSALLMIAPYMENGLNITLTGEIVSRPYINMTLSIMEAWGINCEFSGDKLSVPNSSYRPVDYTVEADWSAASYWFEMAAFSFGDIKLTGLSKASLQGDCRIAELFRNFGIESSWDNEGALQLSPSPDITPRLVTDLSGQPDLAQTIVVTCCVLNIPFIIHGLSTLRIKETDRLAALTNELAKLSFKVDCIDDDTLAWEGQRVPAVRSGLSIETYRDHRMAMAFAPVSFFLPGIIIKDAGVVAKSYPGFWDDMKKAGFTIQEVKADIE